MLTIARLHSEPEIFASLQGEGTRMGVPAVFLRLAGCNLHCRWCDTKHSWSKGIELSEAEIAQRILQYGLRNLVITGGEPLLQQDALAELLTLLPADLFIEIETNGTLLPTPALAASVDQWNISPKLPHAGNDPCACLRPEVLSTFATLPHAWFKFVVQTPADWDSIAALGLPHERILLMPCATTREELLRQAPRIAQLCLEHRVRYAHRLHVALWSDTQGV